MGEICGFSIDEHIDRFKSFLSQSTEDFQSIDVKLVSSQSFLDPGFLNDKETKLLSRLESFQQEYGFDINHQCSTVVQINPDGTIVTPSENEIKYSKMKQKKEVAKANGYGFDYSTKTPCIVDKNLGCYLMNCGTDLQLKLRNSSPEMQRQILEESLGGSFWESLMEIGGVVSIGESPLNPGQMAYFLENFKEVAEINYGYIMNCCEKIDEPASQFLSIEKGFMDFDF